MNIVIFTHPPSMDSTSMPRFASMVGEGMRMRGHPVDYWTSPAILSRAFGQIKNVQKWLRYFDQFLIYPLILKWKLRRVAPETLFIFSDQALGMWVPHVAKKSHVIHVHDFMALRSALGELNENPTGFTGRIYQKWILRGFSHAQNFISVSFRTQEDLHRFLPTVPTRSEVVYNGVNPVFRVMSALNINSLLAEILPPDASRGFIMHVGGNQWYKNREGTIRLYTKWCEITDHAPMPLVMVGAPADGSLHALAGKVPSSGKVYFLSGVEDETLCALYNQTRCLLFPSLEEGFGWPVIEAMACGANVLTTAQPPMTEVGGNAAFYLKRLTHDNNLEWEREGALLLNSIVTLKKDTAIEQRQRNLERAKTFTVAASLDAYAAIYSNIVRGSSMMHDKSPESLS